MFKLIGETLAPRAAPRLLARARGWWPEEQETENLPAMGRVVLFAQELSGVGVVVDGIWN